MNEADDIAGAERAEMPLAAIAGQHTATHSAQAGLDGSRVGVIVATTANDGHGLVVGMI
jgi:hypothetical protein